jgi:hypothetical protein
MSEHIDTEKSFRQFDIGQKLYEEGKPCPWQPPDEEFVAGCTPAAACWLGWTFARAKRLMIEERRMKHWAKHGESHPEHRI